MPCQVVFHSYYCGKQAYEVDDAVRTQGEIVNILLKIKNSFLPTKQILIGL